jgi:flagellar hook-basal body complex protein FliE
MDVRGLHGLGSAKPPLPGAAKPAAPGFGDLLGKLVNAVSDLQTEVDESVRRGATGEPEEVHDMLLAVNKAELSFRLMVEVRNKLVEAYQEVMRLPV